LHGYKLNFSLSGKKDRTGCNFADGIDNYLKNVHSPGMEIMQEHEKFAFR